MKRLLLSAIALFIAVFADAQYNSFYQPTDFNAIREYQNCELNNIWFDEEAIKENPQAWIAYNDYLYQYNLLNEKSNLFSRIGWLGLAISCASIAPLCISTGQAEAESHKTYTAGMAVLATGGAVACIGAIGSIIYMEKINTRKKEIIYYLKKSHNGIGIVGVF